MSIQVISWVELTYHSSPLLGEVTAISNEEIVKTERLDREVIMACGCDLMSDVLSYIKSDSFLLTGLTNPQVVRTAEMAGITAICFVRGKKPQRETIDLAIEKDIPLMFTRFSMFEACGRLYNEGLRGCDDPK